MKGNLILRVRRVVSRVLQNLTVAHEVNNGRIFRFFLFALGYLALAACTSGGALRLPPDEYVVKSVSFYEASNDWERCQAMEDWFEKRNNSLYLGVDSPLKAPRGWGGRYWDAYGFSDEVFLAHFGRSFSDLSLRERRNLRDFAIRCFANLPRLKHELFYTERSDFRPLNSAIQASAATKKIREYSRRELLLRLKRDSRRPYRKRIHANTKIRQKVVFVPRSVTKTQITKTEKCFYRLGWGYRANIFLIHVTSQRLSGKIIPRPATRKGVLGCSSPYNIDKIIESELVLSKSDIGLRVEGDLCNKEPVIILQRHRFRMLERGDSGSYRGIPPYDIYVPNTRIINSMYLRMIAIKALILKQCRRLPKSVVLSGRYYSDSKVIPYQWRNPDPVYSYQEFYRGRFDPNREQLTLVHDDQETAARYTKFARQMHLADIATRKEREERFKRGAALFFMMMFGVHSNSTCNDHSLSKAEKHRDCTR